MDPQALQLNTLLKKHPSLYSLLSKRGKAIYFPKAGILSQTAEAKESKYNATIGIALDDTHKLMHSKSLTKLTTFPAEEVVDYAPSYGHQKLRELWLNELRDKNQTLQGKQISLPQVCAGITHALSIASFLFVDEKDMVSCADLRWENYDLLLQQWYGARIDSFSLFVGEQLNVHGLRQKLREQ